MAPHLARLMLAALSGAAPFVLEVPPGADRLARCLAVARRVRLVTLDRAERRGAWGHFADAVRREAASDLADLGTDHALDRAAARVAPWWRYAGGVLVLVLVQGCATTAPAVNAYSVGCHAARAACRLVDAVCPAAAEGTP